MPPAQLNSIMRLLALRPVNIIVSASIPSKRELRHRVEKLFPPYISNALVHYRTGNNRVTQRGYGDATVRLKYNLLGNDSGWSALAVTPYLKFPTGEENIGNHSIEGGLILPLDVELPWDLDLGLTTRFDAVRDENG